jgi:16S rRNA (guanine966-N2)-methyltransferase
MSRRFSSSATRASTAVPPPTSAPKPAGLGAPFDLVFIDPPYRHGLIPPALEQLASGQWIAPDALVVAETGSDEPELAAPGWDTIDSRVYGAARVSFLRRA